MNLDDEFEDDGVVSANEMTGLITSMPTSQEEKEEYEQIMRFKPKKKK